MMKVRSGQVALYLIVVLVGITILVMMNVGTFLAVRAKNQAMNAGDAAALAVARYQGELLNRIGQWNIEHLKAAVADQAETCEDIAMKQLRCSFLDPLEGIRVGNAAAQQNDAEQSEEMKRLLLDHAHEVHQIYAPFTELYPEPWPGAWEEYAQQFEAAVSGGIWAGPDNIDYLNAAGDHMLLNRQFYNAIAGRNWCWFHFYASDLLDSYSSYQSWGPLPFGELETLRRKCVNSEVYSLHLDFRQGSAKDLLGEEVICRLTGVSPDDLAKSSLITNQLQKWCFYDDAYWRTWWEIDPAGKWQFPVTGRVRDEYDVRGCAAVCRVIRTDIPDLIHEQGANRSTSWSAAAKPFGSVVEKGELINKGFVTPVFTETRLVPLDAAGGRDPGYPTADPEWGRHVREHLTPYCERGPESNSSCWYCQQLKSWENSQLRQTGRNWLKYNSSSCVRPTDSGSEWGGTPHGH